MIKLSGGERGIRTPGGSHLNGFQDRRNRPLCHLSGVKIILFKAKSKISALIGKMVIIVSRDQPIPNAASVGGPVCMAGLQ